MIVVGIGVVPVTGWLTGSGLEIHEGRHPVVEQSLQGRRYIPNDVIFEDGEIASFVNVSPSWNTTTASGASAGSDGHSTAARPRLAARRSADAGDAARDETARWQSGADGRTWRVSGQQAMYRARAA